MIGNLISCLQVAVTDPLVGPVFVSMHAECGPESLHESEDLHMCLKACQCTYKALPMHLCRCDRGQHRYAGNWQLTCLSSVLNVPLPCGSYRPCLRSVLAPR
jgi:hypothetical protein